MEVGDQVSERHCQLTRYARQIKVLGGNIIPKDVNLSSEKTQKCLAPGRLDLQPLNFPSLPADCHNLFHNFPQVFPIFLATSRVKESEAEKTLPGQVSVAQRYHFGTGEGEVKSQHMWVSMNGGSPQTVGL